MPALGTSRGALYKTLHEARTRLRAELGAAGLEPDHWQHEAVRRWRSACRRAPAF